MKQIAHLNSKQQHGFTLVEMLVVLAVSAIILSIAAPSFMNIIANNRVASAANEMVVFLNLAKSEAVKSGQTAVLCKRTEDGAGCNHAKAWSDGWIIFIDEDDNDTVTAGERVIRVHEATHPSLDFNFFVSNAVNPGPIRFRPNGRIQPNDGRFCIRNAHDEANSRAVDITMGRQIQTNVFDLSNNNC